MKSLWSRLVLYLKERTNRERVLGGSVSGPFTRWVSWRNSKRVRLLLISVVLGTVFVASYWFFGQLLDNLTEESTEEPVEITFNGEQYSEFYTVITPVEDIKEELDIQEVEEWQWPLWGVIEKQFGWIYSETLEAWVFHEGIDILSAQGAEIVAVASGVVRDVYFDPQLGLTIVIDHGDGLESIYASCHLSHVQANKEVAQGEVIAEVGNSALYETELGYHLHFAIRLNEEFIDPLIYLPR